MSLRNAIRAMRQASRDYKSPPITWQTWVSAFVVSAAIYVAIHGWRH
jgi:hypothetical protein